MTATATAALLTVDSEQPEEVMFHYENAEENSNKDYLISLVQDGDGWRANFAHGKHGSSLKPGCKTGAASVPYAKAKKEYDKMYAERLAKGYQPAGSGGAFVQAAGAKVPSGIAFHLLVAIDREEAPRYIADDDWMMQEKKDGERLGVRADGSAPCDGINKKGFVVGYPAPIGESVGALNRQAVVDGENVKGHLHAFDLLELDGVDLRALPAIERLARLEKLALSSAVDVVATAYTTAEKQALYDRLLAENREGVVFKRKDAPYVAGKLTGKRAKGATQVKCKFYETASVVVSAHNDKRSVSIEVLDDATRIAVGNVTIPENRDVPAVGSVIEVRYLYAYRGTNAMSQTVYLELRHDTDPEECTFDQLKYKPD